MRAFRPTPPAPDITGRLSELNAAGRQTKALMSAAGDYWRLYYRDYEDLVAATTGCIVPLGSEYRRVLGMALESNIHDAPFHKSEQLELLCFDEREAEITPDAITFRATNAKAIKFLSSTLFDAPVVLERGTHFDLDQDTGDLTFYVDIFNDPDIVRSAYRFDNYPNRRVLFWGTGVVKPDTSIFDRYGRFLYREAEDSERYAWMVKALMYFYTQTKGVKQIEDVLNILYGVPFALSDGETVTSLHLVDANLTPVDAVEDDDGYTCVETRRADGTTARYYMYAYAEPTVAVGDTVERFTLFARFHKVDDYLTDPTWLERARIPQELFEGDISQADPELIHGIVDNVLKYNMIHADIKISYQTLATYRAQSGELHKIIKSGIPVYLYPCISTVFRSSFTEKVDSDDDFLMRAELPGMKTLYADRFDRYNGEHTYNADALYDHGSRFTTSAVLFDGSVSYSGRGTHREHEDAGGAYDGGFVYDGVLRGFHDAERDILEVASIRTDTVDEFRYSKSDGSMLVYGTYNGLGTHDGRDVFGLNLEQVLEVSGTANLISLDNVPPASETFELRVVPREASA